MVEPDIEENPEKVGVYAGMSEYPLPGHLVTYRYKPHGQTTTFNDLITLNLHELLPNRLLGKYHNKTDEEIEQWIEMTDTYGRLVYEEFHNKCNKQLQTIRNIHREEEQRNKFDPKKVSYLPTDVQYYIQSYLPAETRLILLETKHVDIKKDMKKWKLEHLRKFYRGTVHDSVKNIRENYRRRCLEHHDFRLSITTKGDYIDEIFKIIDMYKKAVPRDIEKYYRYKKEATKLFMAILYVNKKINNPPVPAKNETTKQKKKDT